jgi:hypothetical protein|tara:strand:- start:60 stop:248 length:189 start_codon:yes stop_codon:yes gene_type:complete
MMSDSYSDQVLIVWVMEYYDTVAGEKSLDLYKTEEMAKEDKRKLTADGTISDVLIYQRMVWQ